MTDENAELLAELQRLFEQPKENNEQPGITFKEIKKHLGWSSGKIYDALHALHDAGQLEAIQASRRDIAGRPSYSVVYRPVNKEVV